MRDKGGQSPESSPTKPGVHSIGQKTLSQMSESSGLTPEVILCHMHIVACTRMYTHITILICTHKCAEKDKWY